MKNSVKAVLCFLLISASVNAQTDPKAKAILAEVSKKYRALNVIRAAITIQSENQQAKSKDMQTGTLYVQSAANKYKLLLNDREMISDGKTQWTWLKDEKEVQVSDAVNGDESLNPAKIFLIYEKGFKYLYAGESKLAGRSIHTIELTPLDSKRSYFKIRLSIDKLLKQIKSAVIFDKNGNRYTYTVKSMTPAVKLTPSFFSFDSKQHPGVEVVDLR